MKLHQLIRIALLSLLAVAAGTTSLAARSKVVWQAYSLPELKVAMHTLGVGEQARVIVTLGDGTKLTGYVSQADDQHFVVVAGGKATPVEYEQVADIRAGNPLTQVKFAARITTEAGAAAAVTPVPVTRTHERLSAAAKAALILGLTAAGIVASLAIAGKL